MSGHELCKCIDKSCADATSEVNRFQVIALAKPYSLGFTLIIEGGDPTATRRGTLRRSAAKEELLEHRQSEGAIHIFGCAECGEIGQLLESR
jgi:hypothetical protein